MQDGQFSPLPNTPFEDQLNLANQGRLASMQNQVDPEIALKNKKIELDNEINSTINSIYNIKESKLQGQTISPYDIDVSGRFNKQILGEDNEDLYAQNQTWGGKAINGLLKGVSLAGSTFLQGTVGLVAGLANVVSGNGADSFYNNSFSNAIDTWNKNTEDWLPNYYTKKERDAAWYEPSNLFTANFLFDKFIKNLGFSIGAIYSGAAVTKALKLIPAINTLFTGGKATQALTQIEQKLAMVPATQRTSEMYNILRQASDAVIGAKKFGTQAERFIVGSLGAATEGGIEALQGLNEHRNHLIQEYTATNGVAPTGEALDKINSYAENLGNARFIMNMGLLTATNYIMLPKILGSSYKTSKGLANQEVNNVVKNADGVWTSALSQAPKAIKALSKTKNIGGLFFSPTEGFEEISQYAIERGVQDYYNKAYRGEGRDWLSSISAGYDQAINSDEGMEQFLIGGLSGGMQQAGFISKKGFGKSGNIKERGWTGTGGERGKNTETFLTLLNDPTKKITFKSDAWLKDMALATSRAVNLQKEGEAFIRQGDVLEAKDNEFDYLHNYLTPRIKHGRYDLVTDDIENFRQQGSTEQGLNELKQQNIANENDTILTFSQRISNFARHAENVNSLYQSLNLTYGGLINKETGKNIYSDEVIDKMVYAASKIADYDQRIPELSKEVLSRGIALPTTIQGALNDDKEALTEAIKQIDELPIIDTKKDELKDSLRDVIEMSLRRKEFLDEYKALKTTPSAFESPKATVTNTTETPPPSKITLKTKKGDEELEVGVEYYLGKVTEEDKDGNEVYRFPKITILGENEDGTIKVQTSTGLVKDVSKSVLEDYKLGKVSDLKNNKTANYYFNHINDVFQYNFGKDDKLGKRPGRIQYEKGKLFFVYKDLNGKIKRKQLFREHFIAQEGFKDARIKVLRTLQAESAEKRAAREEFLKEQTEEEKRIIAEQKQDARLQIVVEAQTEVKARLATVKDKLEKNKEKLVKIDEQLNELKEDKKASEERTKKGKLRDAKYPELSKAKAKLAKIFKTIPKAISELSKIKEDVEYDISKLTVEQEELEFNLTYLEDLGQNISELSANSVVALKELTEQKDWIDALIKETGSNINVLTEMSKSITATIKDLTNLLEEAVAKFNKDYPQPLKDSFERMRNSNGVLAEIELVKTYIAENSFIEDLQKEISLNQKELEAVDTEIDKMYTLIDQYGKELSAKQLILDKFQAIADAFRAKEAAKKRFEADKALHDALFKAQSDITEQPVDDTDTSKGTPKEWDETPKQDLSTYPVSTAFTTRELDPTFESKEHLLREEQFLNNFSSGDLKDAQGNDITPEVRVLVVHKGNQAQLGLNGLVELRNPAKENETPQAYEKRLNDPKIGTILYVYIKKGEGVWEVIDETGKTISKLTAEFKPEGKSDVVVDKASNVGVVEGSGGVGVGVPKEVTISDGTTFSVLEEKTVDIKDIKIVGENYDVKRLLNNPDKLEGTVLPSAKQLYEKMKKGEFVEDAVPILISPSGNLLDGNNRIHAYLANGVDKVKVLVVKPKETTKAETPTPKGNTSNVTAEQVRNKLQEIEKQPVKINITQDANGKMEQTSQEVIDKIKAELDKTGLPYNNVVSNDKGSTYFVVTKDGQQHEVLKVLQSGGKLVPTNLTKAKWINHLIKTEKDAVVKAVEQSLKAEDKAPVTKPEGEIDINKVVTSIAKTSTSIADKNLNYTNKGSLDAKAVEKAWEEERTKMLTSSDMVLGVRGVSRGVKQITNTSDKNPIVPTLTKDAKPGMIKVSTTNVINTPNQSIFYKAGRAYLQIGDNIIFVNNRNINKQEADAIFLVLKEVADRFQTSLKEGTPQLDKPLVAWLNSVIYWYSPTKDQKAHNQQIFIKSGQLYISGVNTGIYFSPDQLEENRDPIINTFLQGNTAGQGTYHHVSHKALSEEGEYVSYYTEDGKTLKTRTYPSYQDYLLENKVISTNVRPKMTETDSNIRGRYAIMDIDLNLPEPKQNQPKQTPVVKTTTPAATGKTLGILEQLEANRVSNLKEFAAKIAAETDDKQKAALKARKYYQDNKEEIESYIADPSGQPVATQPAAKPANTVALTPQNKSTTSKTENLTVEIEANLEDLFKAGYTGNVTQNDDDEYRRIVEEDAKNVTPENWGVVLNWFKKNLPNVPVERVEHILKVTGGGWAWGKFGKDGITLYENAKEGTGYHEAFEAVWSLFTTAEEKNNVLADIRKRTGTFFDVISRNQQSYSSATDAQLKEVLADEFADFVQKEARVTEKTKGQFWLVRVFRQLWEFIKNIGKVNQDNIDQLFKNINTGWYSTRPVVIPNNTQDQYSRVAGLPHLTTKDLMEDITSRLMNNFFGEKATLSLANLSDNKAIPLDLYYDRIKEVILNKYVALAKEAYTKNDNTLAMAYITLVQNVRRDWADVVALNKEYVKSFGIAKTNSQETASEEAVKMANTQSVDEEEQTNEEAEQIFEGDNKSQLEYDRDIFTISGKANASAGIRLLLSTLRDAGKLPQDKNDPSVLPNIRFKESSIGGYKFLDYAKVFNQLANALVNTNKIDNILRKLVRHAKLNPHIIDLVRKLKINTSTGQINYQALTYDQWRILLDFVKTMSKQNPPAFIYTNQGDTSQFIPGDKASAIEQIKNGFKQNIKQNKNLFEYVKKTKMFQVVPEFFKKFPEPTKEEDYIKFVNAIGFKELNGESISSLGYRVLSAKEKQKFKEAVNQLYTQLKKQAPIFDTAKGKGLQFATPINTIATSIISMSKDDGVNTFLNILRRPVQTVVLNNPLATFFNNFNNVADKQELNQEEKGLQEGFSQNSVVLANGGKFFTKDGVRTDEQIQIGYFDGVKNIKGAKQSAKLSLINRRLNTFNLNLRGWFIPITNGDKKTEWMLSMGNHISFKEVSSGAMWDRVYDIFQSYLKTEIDVAQTDAGKNLAALKKQGRSGNLRFFLSILPQGLITEAKKTIDELGDAEEFISQNSEAINKAVKIFLEKEANKTKSEFFQYGVFSEIQDTESVNFNGVDDSFIYSNINDNGSNRFTKKQANDTVLYRTINQVINNIEIHKLVIGDPAFMTDPAKRIPGAMGGVNQSVYGSQEFNTIFSKLLNRVDVDNTSTAVTEKDYGYTHLSDNIPTVVYKDVEVAGRVEGKAYEGTVETDGFSKMTLPAYRELKSRTAEWTSQQEDQYQYQMAFFRDRASKEWGYKYSSKELAKHDADLLAKGIPYEGVFEILKPKGWGQNDNSNYKDIVFLKTSTQPLIPTAIVGKNNEKLLKKMLDEGIKVAAFESSIKTGVRETTSFYSEDGGFNNKKYPTGGVLNPTWKDLGIQVETQFSQGKTTLTFGSQLSTLSCLNLLSAGIPEGFTSQQWDALSETDKERESPAYREVKRNNTILRELTNNGYETLLEKLGLVETVEGYEITDYQLVVDYIKEQSRDMDDNTRAALKIDELTGQLATPLEAIPTYTSLKAVLYSIVDKNIASPKTSGIGLVQMPSTGTESENRTVLVGNSTYKFYTKEEPWIEISLPAWFRDKLVAHYTSRNLPVPSDEKLISLLNDESILDGIGFRIPTQEMNSVEVFKIKSFLPKVMGNAVIVPSEITKKAGSDFDIDKLNAYLKNVFINSKGQIDKIHSFDTQQEAKTFFEQEFTKKYEDRISKISNYEEFRGNLLLTFDAIESIQGEMTIEKINAALGSELKEFYDYHIDLLQDIIEQAAEEGVNPSEYMSNQINRLQAEKEKLTSKMLSDVMKKDYVNARVRKSLENAYYESLQTLVQLPENYERLLATNTTEDLERIKNTLNKTLYTPEEIKEYSVNTGEKAALSYLSILSPNSLDEIRHNLITGKDGVGIAAAAQKSNSVMQRLPVTLDFRRANLLFELDPLRVRYMGDGVIRFPHNTFNGLPTISVKTTKRGKKLISDVISQYINGFVDIVKNTFIIEMGVNTRTAGVFLFMDRLGNDTEHTTYFMNQPVIREYLKLLDRMGINGIRSKLAIEEIQQKWGTETYEEGEFLPSAEKLLDNIQQYRDKNRDFTNLSTEFITEQAQIFTEFLKYQEMAGDLFNLMQGVNWDTAHMSDPEMFLLKDMKFWKANNTIFTPASEILKTVFIGDVRENLMKARNAIGSFIAIEHPKVREVLETVKTKFINLGFFPSPDDYSRIASRINNSFINYILQVKAGLSQKTLTNILVNDTTSAATLLEELQQTTPKDSSLYGILSQFRVERRGTDVDNVKAIIFKKSGSDKYDRDGDIDNLRILKENGHTQALYGRLVRAALLQSGAQYSPISFSHLIPNEDYAAALGTLMKNLENYTDLNNFVTSNAFVRNSWSTNGVIPNATLSKKQVKDRRDEGGNLWAAPFSLPRALSQMPPGSIYTSIQFKGDFIKYQPINAEGLMKYIPGEHMLLNVKAAMEQANPLLFRTYLYEVVKDEFNKPVTIKSGDFDVYVYKAINAWGDGMYAQEYYDGPRLSQIENNTYRVDENVVNDATILKALGKPVTSSFEEFKKELKKKDCN